MKKILAAFLLVLPTAVLAAGDQEFPHIYSKLKPKVGAWAEYSVVTKKGEKTKRKSLFRMSVVGKQGDAVWIEQKMTPQIPKPKREGEAGVMKMLVGKEGAEKMYMKTSHGVMDMSGMMGAHKKQEGAGKTKMTEAGEETVEVPAGKFKATRFTFDDGKGSGDGWIKPGVGPYGMIKQTHRDGKETMTMELLAKGDDAKSEVDEKTAQSAFGMAMDRPPRGRKAKAQEEASEGSDEQVPAAPGMGDMFKKAMRKKAGLE